MFFARANSQLLSAVVKKHVNLAVLAAAEPLNIRTWSGTPYFMTEALQNKFPDARDPSGSNSYDASFGRRQLAELSYAGTNLSRDGTQSMLLVS